MFKSFFIKRINKKFEGKELYFCNRIYEDITFFTHVICKCCHCAKERYNPPFLQKENITNFSLLKYLTAITKIMEQNQNGNGPCIGCKFLKKQRVPHFKDKEIIKFFTINHFTKCNSNCVYCAIQNKTLNPTYKLLPIIKKFYKQNIFDKECLINWGGGEPTLCTDFEDICSFFIEKNIHQAINSSGIKFSQTILNGLKTNALSIQISPDAGTKETYTKIKRQNNFDLVWENIKNYTQYPDMVFIKYIFFSYNSSENEVRSFIQKCIENNVKNIVIDCESNSERNPLSPFGRTDENTINLAILMKKLAIENGINYQVSYQWTDEHQKKITEG